MIGHLSGGAYTFCPGRKKRETRYVGSDKFYAIVFTYVLCMKQGMVSSGRNNPDFDSVLRVPIQELVIDKDLQKSRTFKKVYLLFKQRNEWLKILIHLSQ